MLCVPNADVAVASAISAAHKDASTVGIGAAVTAVGYIDSGQAILSAQSSAFSGLESVLAKIDVFVKIVDQTASVSGSVYFPSALTHLALGTPLFQSCLADCIFCVQRELARK